MVLGLKYDVDLVEAVVLGEHLFSVEHLSRAPEAHMEQFYLSYKG